MRTWDEVMRVSCSTPNPFKVGDKVKVLCPRDLRSPAYSIVVVSRVQGNQVGITGEVGLMYFGRFTNAVTYPQRRSKTCT